jgi:hypothetical protein
VNENDFRQVASLCTWGSKEIAIKIMVAGGPSLEASGRICGRVLEDLKENLLAAQVREGKDFLALRSAERDSLISLFPREIPAIYVEEIPNGYCSQSCCLHLPWLIVTTPAGHIRIGWRKRVIEIDWSRTTGTKTAAELFPNENVTKSERMIHAWGNYEAKTYLRAILNLEIANS